MLRHIVLFRWREDVTEAQVAPVLDRIRELPERIGGVEAFALRLDAGEMSGNHDAAIVADFPDATSFHAYQQHPVHVELVKEHLGPLLAERAAVQVAVE